MAKKITNEQKRKAEDEILKQSKVVRYDTKDFTIGYIVSVFNDVKESTTTEIEMSNPDKMFVIPEYQRNYIWKLKDKSLFIESVLLGLPIPFLFFYEREDGFTEIVDGVQRITTLYSFINNDFKLCSLKKLETLNGFYYKDLSEIIQKKFKNKALRIIVLDSDTTLGFRQDLFSRVNRSGKKITDAEFRRGTFPGELTSFIEKCTENPLFKKLCPLTKAKQDRYAQFELLLRFFAYLNNYNESKHDVAIFLDNFLLNNQSTFDRNVYEQEFNSMCLFVDKYFTNGFAKPDSKHDVPNVRFEAISVGVALALRENKELNPTNLKWLESDKFKEITTSDSSNNSGRLKERVEYVRDQLLGAHCNVEN